MNTFSYLKDFISESKTAYHAVRYIRSELLKAGYVELSEGDAAAFRTEGKYFVTRNSSSIIAFRCSDVKDSFMITASHSDTPTFRVKTLRNKAGVTQATVEKYGGAIHHSWLDRPLSIAGRVTLRTEGGISIRYFDIDRDIFVIPSVAIHQMRQVNDGVKLQPADDMVPMLSLEGNVSSLEELVASELSVDACDVISHDLYLYNRETPRLVGYRSEFVLSPRLDDLECTFAAMKAFLSSEEKSTTVPVFAVFDNEEVGSETKQGAASTFLYDTLLKIAGNTDEYFRLTSQSFMASIDNAHAVHPNHPELSDPTVAPKLGGGIVVKYNSNQRYATDSVSAAVFKSICDRAGAKYQSFYSHPNFLCGSTLGSISNTKVSIMTADIGLAQLAMHSSTETAHVGDVDDLVLALTLLFKTSLKISGDNVNLL